MERFLPTVKREVSLEQLPTLKELLTPGVDVYDTGLNTFICGLRNSIINTLKLKDELSDERDIFKSIDSVMYLLNVLEEIQNEYLSAMKGGEA